MACSSCSFKDVRATSSLTNVEVIDTDWLSSSSSGSITPSNRCNRVAASVHLASISLFTKRVKFLLDQKLGIVQVFK